MAGWIGSAQRPDVTGECAPVMETRPSVAHFATHIVQDRPSTNALIALSVSGAGHEEFLSPAEIGGWNLDGGLVVLSGCSSGVAVAPKLRVDGYDAGLADGRRPARWWRPNGHSDDVGVFSGASTGNATLGIARPADALRARSRSATVARLALASRFLGSVFVLGNY